MYVCDSAFLEKSSQKILTGHPFEKKAKTLLINVFRKLFQLERNRRTLKGRNVLFRFGEGVSFVVSAWCLIS